MAHHYLSSRCCRVFLLLSVSLAWCLPVAAQPSSFVRVQDGQFLLDGEPYYFAGINVWFGMNLGADLEEGDRERLERELDHLQDLGITNLRVMAASEGPESEPWRVHPAVQNAPGEYDEDLLRGLDVLLAEMAERDMRAVLVLNNFFQWTGGMAQYVSWATGTPIPYPTPEQGGPSWDDFQKYAARFYATPRARKYFFDYINEIVHRKNHVTGRLYRDDPTIMAWQLANEPRGFEYEEQYVDWVKAAAGFLQLIDENHLVSLGGEGKLHGPEGTAFTRVSRSPQLDYLTIHLWIENWGWYDPERPEATFPQAVGRAMAYLADHVNIAHAIGKPLVLEEFGVSRDLGDYAPEATTTYRDDFFQMVLEALYRLALEGAPAAGSNLWSWAGEGRPEEPGTPWKPDDAFTGDPPHEQQGWYSINDDDESTLEVLSTYADRMDALGEEVPVAPAEAQTAGHGEAAETSTEPLSDPSPPPDTVRVKQQ